MGHAVKYAQCHYSPVGRGSNRDILLLIQYAIITRIFTMLTMVVI